ncbi:DEAD/DEAH box helicase family protein [Clostridium transplantifaecale]|uniref:DEAD/DEAH box helicase family protein n=1 Tax=Clostridium transplantifaecale TaxID=2479838 RepID=UPI0013DD9A39|nr:DEAD/DEAH box helicase family protein [Clostridium transplantifaecale]
MAKYIDEEVKKQIMTAEPGTVVLLDAPVGSGKTTFCITELLYYCKVWNKKMLLTVNRSALRGQLRATLYKRFGVNEGLPFEEKGVIEFDNLTVTSYQFLQRLFENRIGEFDKVRIGATRAADFDFMVADEIHYLFSDSLFSAQTGHLKKMPRTFWKAVRIYISATLKPVRKLLLEMEGIEDLYEGIDEFEKKYSPVRYMEAGLLETMIKGGPFAREVLELKGAEPNFSYFLPYIYEEQNDLLELIKSQREGGNLGRWLVFVDSKRIGRETKEGLQAMGISAAFISADEMEPDDTVEWQQLLKEGKFSVQVLLATAVIDNGVSITDNQVTNLVISGYEGITAVQQAGRVRIKKKGKTVKLFICRHSADYFNKKRFALQNRLRAFHVFDSGTEWEREEYLLRWGNDSVSGMLNKGMGGKHYVNPLAGKALEYFIEELSENIALIAQGGDSYVKKILNLFGIEYNQESDELKKRQREIRRELKAFLQQKAGCKCKTDAEWDLFRERLRDECERLGEPLSVEHKKRLPGIKKVREVCEKYGFYIKGKGERYLLEQMEEVN